MKAANAVGLCSHLCIVPGFSWCQSWVFGGLSNSQQTDVENILSPPLSSNKMRITHTGSLQCSVSGTGAHGNHRFATDCFWTKQWKLFLVQIEQKGIVICLVSWQMLKSKAANAVKTGGRNSLILSYCLCNITRHDSKICAARKMALLEHRKEYSKQEEWNLGLLFGMDYPAALCTFSMLEGNAAFGAGATNYPLRTPSLDDDGRTQAEEPSMLKHAVSMATWLQGVAAFSRRLRVQGKLSFEFWIRNLHTKTTPFGVKQAHIWNFVGIFLFFPFFLHAALNLVDQDSGVELSNRNSQGHGW